MKFSLLEKKWSKVGLIIQVKMFVSELRQQTLWKTNDEDTVLHWSME